MHICPDRVASLMPAATGIVAASSLLQPRRLHCCDPPLPSRRPVLVHTHRDAAGAALQRHQNGWPAAGMGLAPTSRGQRRNQMSGEYMEAAKPLWSQPLRGGAHWSGVIRRGLTLRLTATGSDANVAALFYSHEQPLERYNMADTLKAQHTAHLTTGCVCYSDMGRILCSITADTCGWHDPLCGLTDAAQIAARYGATRFQEQRNQRFVSGRDAMLVELGKYGLNERDLVANINFFSKVVVDEAGSMHLASGHSKAGQYVDLRFEMDTIVAL